MDHLNQIPGVGPHGRIPMLEAGPSLAALARETSRVRLGHARDSGVTYRNPALLAKTATTLDVISGGRAIFGLGAAWYDAEHRAFGFDFPPIGERMDRLDEALAIIEGDVHPGPPLVRRPPLPASTRRSTCRDRSSPAGRGSSSAAAGEQRTLKIAAKHADMTHWFPLGLEALRAQDGRPGAATARRSAAIPAPWSGPWRAPVDRGRDRGRRPRRLGAASPRSGAATTRARNAGPGRRRPPAVPGRGLHRLHVQQQRVRHPRSASPSWASCCTSSAGRRPDARRSPA